MSDQQLKLLIIVNDILPYGPEIINVLASPEGSLFRFRYQRRYIPTIENHKALEGKMGTIILRNFQSGSFLPIRKMSVTSVKVIGDIIYLIVKLDSTAAIKSIEDYKAKKTLF